MSSGVWTQNCVSKPAKNEGFSWPGRTTPQKYFFMTVKKIFSLIAAILFQPKKISRFLGSAKSKLQNFVRLKKAWNWQKFEPSVRNKQTWSQPWPSKVFISSSRSTLYLKNASNFFCCYEPRQLNQKKLILRKFEETPDRERRLHRRRLVF